MDYERIFFFVRECLEDNTNEKNKKTQKRKLRFYPRILGKISSIISSIYLIYFYNYIRFFLLTKNISRKIAQKRRIFHQFSLNENAEFFIWKKLGKCKNRTRRMIEKRSDNSDDLEIQSHQRNNFYSQKINILKIKLKLKIN